MKIFGLNSKDLTIEEKLDFIVEHRNQIFDETFQYKKIYENIRKKL